MKRLRSYWGAAVVTVLLGVAAMVVAGAPDDDLARQYNEKFNKLARDDLSGHYQLALWCKDKGAYKLLLRQANYILGRDKDHAPAKLLRELAKRELDAAGGGDDAPPGQKGRQSQRELGRILTDEEIQSIRRHELYRDHSERVSVKFNNDVLRRFFAEMEGTADFDYSRKEFFKLRHAKKAQLIMDYAPDTFGKDLEIRSDPARMGTFRRQVLPFVIDNCATAACHGTKGKAEWRIYNDKIQSTPLVYTNYLLLHNLDVGNERLINRDLPDRSLLLQFGLPPAAGEIQHPVEIQPAFGGKNDRRYRQVSDWLESLNPQAPDYGITLEPAVKP